MRVSKSLRYSIVLMLLSLSVHSLRAAPPVNSLTSEQQEQLAEAEKLNDRIVELGGTGNFRDALPLARQSLLIYKQVLGQEHPDTATPLNNLGFLLQCQGDYSAARPYLEQAYRIRRNVLGEWHSDTALSLNNLAGLLIDQGDFIAARPFLEQALKINKKVRGDEHPDTAMSLDNLGLLLELQGDYAVARQYFELALKIRKKVQGEWHSDTAKSFSRLGALLQAQGDYVAARQYLEQTLKICKKALGDEHLDTATVHNNLGGLLQVQGDYAAARPHLEHALKICKKVLGEEHRHTATFLNNLGVLLKDQGDYAAARMYYEQALKINKTVLGESHPDTAHSLNNLGILLKDQGDYASARPYLEQALKINKTVLGESHPGTALSLNNLGILLNDQGDCVSARPYLEQALKINKTVLGESHPDTAKSLNNLGGLLRDQGDYAAARPCYEQALKISKTVLGESHPDTAKSLQNLAELEVAIGHWNIAGNLLDQARRGTRRHVAHILPALSEKEQISFLRETYETPFYRALTLGLMQLENQEQCALSAGWILNGKGVAQIALVERVLLTRDVQNPQLSATIQELLEVRRKLAGVAISAPRKGEETARREMMERLTTQEERLARQLAEAKGRTPRTDPWVELADVRHAIPTNGVLIDFARFDVFNFNAKGTEKKWQAAHYAAWIIPAAGEIQIVDLGPADSIEAAVERARRGFEGVETKDSVRSKRGERVAEQQVQQDLQAVADQVWKPLADKLGTADRLILSPDAALWLVPWGALPVADNKYLIEEYAITYLVSGRDLVVNQKAKLTTSKPVLFANPDFDLEAEQVQTAIHTVFHNLKLDEEGQTRALSAQNALPKFERLPGTAKEVQLIKPGVQRYTGTAPQVYSDQYALETIFKQVQSPKLAVLSTHGFFLPDQDVKRQDNRLASSDNRAIPLALDGQPIENPLLRCGLLFAGCNVRQRVGGDDGILTGMEIVGIDLRGTELVVLSACETGVGQVRNGEGVAGLRQAFQLAGAEAVVATLWQIPDAESAWTMNDFFANLAQGQNKTDALRAAQLKRIAVRRDRYGAAHPYFWAAFTLTGM